jgi:hypothetical protein
VVLPRRDAKRAECLHNRDAEIAGSHQGGEPAGPADGVHDIRPLTAPARPQRVTERGYAGQRFRVTPLAGRADRDVHDAQAAAEFGAIRHVRLSFCAYTVTLCSCRARIRVSSLSPASSGRGLAPARGCRGLTCCATMTIFIGCLLAGESSSRCLARETENDA